MKCLLDLDGVLVDFVKGSCDLHQQPDPFDGTFFDWEWIHRFNMSPRQFWSPMDREFWANLGWMPDGKEIHRVVEDWFGIDNVCILSSPCMTDGCLEGKMDWLKVHLPNYTRRFLFGPRKEFCANPNNVMIDDNDGNIESFRDHGGLGILVPRPWNKNRDLVGQSVQYIKEELEVLS